jgi:hypothetical protein
MSENIATAITIVKPSDADRGLSGLIAEIRKAHAGVICAFANAIEHALVAGNALNEMDERELVRHGQWAKVYKECGLGDRQAERYKRLAGLVKSNPTCKSEMTGLSIEGALKKLTPPRDKGGNPSESKEARASTPPTPARGAAASHFDILEAWQRTSPIERERAVDSIGLVPWLDALPRDWVPQLERLLAERRQSIVPPEPEPVQTPDDPSVPGDLSVPAFLRRESGANNDDVPTTINSEDAAEILVGEDRNEDEEDPDEDEEEEDQKPKRQPKVVQGDYTIEKAIDIALTDLADLASSCRDAVDNLPESLQQSDRSQRLTESADALEDIERPDITVALGGISVTCALPKRRYASRQARASDANSLLEACVKVLNEITNKEEHDEDACVLITALKHVIDTVDCCEFPGMCG